MERVQRRASRLSVKGKRLARRARPEWLVRRSRLGGFAIAHTARCGSTVLGDLLRQHPDVSYGGEILNLHLTRLKATGREDAWAEVDPRAVLVRELRVMGPGWVGFEYLPRELRVTGTDLEAYVRMLRDLGFGHFILLRRENLLRRYLSLRLAQSSTLWHARQHMPLGGREHRRVSLEVRGLAGRYPDLLDQFAGIEQFYDDLRAIHSHDPLLELTYEQHIEPDPRIGYDEVAQFLGLRPFTPHVRVNRINTRSVRECVTNFDEVVDMLGPTRYSWMLDT